MAILFGNLEMLLAIYEFVWESGMSTENRNFIHTWKGTLSLLLSTRNTIRAISIMILPSSSLKELSTTVTSITTRHNFTFYIFYLCNLNFNFSPHIAPVCVPQRYQEFAGSRCWVSGWGKDAFETGGKYQNILKVIF